LTTIASFGNLAFSVHVGMASMGRLLTLGMICVLLATLVVLPAALDLPAVQRRLGRGHAAGGNANGAEGPPRS
ncbi:MAG: hypothetical protein R3266_03835, partial [Gemmatimonadota bacterium]|nr:hypothetical protein [Gemmatimonadota bacterium]